MLFSEIDPRFYERMDFVPVPLVESVLEVDRKRGGAPAMLVRSGDERDIPAVIEMSAAHASRARLALDRSEDFFRYGLTKKRLLSGLGPLGLRNTEFLVVEEGHQAVAYLISSEHEGRWMIEEAGEDDEHADIANRERAPLRTAHALAEQKNTQHEHDRGREIQDEALEARADELQSCEIEKARQVVAAETESEDDEPIVARERRRLAARPPREQCERRQREQHAQHDQRHRVDAVAVGQLDDDRLAREGNGTGQGQRQARPQRRSRGDGVQKPAASPSRRGSLAAA